MELQNETKNDSPKNPTPKCDEEVAKVQRTCIACGSSTNKFKPKARKCIRCYSKTKNEKFKNKDYFKQYYLDHKPTKPPKPPAPPPAEPRALFVMDRKRKRRVDALMKQLLLNIV